MDIFGSNATPMGGSLGRADALVGGIEAQKAERVLHMHCFFVSADLALACEFERDSTEAARAPCECGGDENLL